jgi:hypothetical protein
MTETNNKLMPCNKVDKATAATEVAVCFHDLAIAHLFAQLLRNRGGTPLIVREIEAAHSTRHVITEPELFEELPAPANHLCLIVGNRPVDTPTPAIQVLQPLSEAKIEAALDRFLQQ